ncbi:MAG: type II secretion system F family protein [Chloroflexi bacterium]|nr:type II secretion system F family protein [Chloroflexota bacterium]
MTAIELVAILAGTSVLLLAFAVYQVSVHSALELRLRVFVKRDPIATPVAVMLPKKESSVPLVERMNKRLRRANFARKLQQRLVRAGIRIAASQFVLLQTMASSIGFLAVMVGSSFIPDLDVLLGLGLAGGGAAAGWYIPMMAVGIMESQRLKKFEKQLPTTIDAMAGALQAGSSLPQAMEMVGREMTPPINEELALVVREMGVGVPMQDAFANMVERVPSLDLDMLVTAITIQHRVGGNLSQILRAISHTIRERLRIRGEIAILTAQQRMSSYIVAALPVLIVLALFVIAPGYISKLFQPGIARMLLVMGMLGMLAGFYAMSKIADIDV